MKKVIVLVAASVIFMCVLLSGCGALNAIGPNEKFDPTKEQLYVGNYDGGMGVEWLSAVAREFEKENPEIQVWIDNKKEEYMGERLLNSISLNRQMVYFTSEVIYEDAVAQGKFADITDIVTEKAEEVDGVKVSIEDKMNNDYLRDYFKTKAPNDSEEKYYAIPFFTAVYGMVYNVDLFESKNLYNLPNYSSSFGPDGVEGNGDDGLPATWEDFKKLMERMRSAGIIPFTWAGMGNEYYRHSFLRGMWASYEGHDDYMLNFSFDGTDDQEDIGKITSENGYLLQKQNGKMAAITAAKDIVSKEEYYSRDAFTTSQSHTGAQSEFLLAGYDGKTPIGMLLEGGWWENEARTTFEEMAIDNENLGYGKRKFGYMPYPKFEGTAGVPNQTNKKTTLYSDGRTMCFINAAGTPREIEMAKKFLQFSTSNASLARCTKTTGVVRPYKYSLTEDDLAEMTPYGQSMWNIYKAPESELVVAYSQSELRNLKGSYFTNWDFYTTVGTKIFSDPLLDFSENKNVTATQYFNGMQAFHTSDRWADLLKQ